MTTLLARTIFARGDALSLLQTYYLHFVTYLIYALSTHSDVRFLHTWSLTGTTGSEARYLETAYPTQEKAAYLLSPDYLIKASLLLTHNLHTYCRLDKLPPAISFPRGYLCGPIKT